MHTRIVTEVDGWHSVTDALDVIDATSAANGYGVIVKGTQGVTWKHPDYDTIYDDATGAGLLVGHLHYCEPGNNEIGDEASAVIAALKGRPYGLGVWLEVGESFGKADYEVSAWVNDLAVALTTATRRVAVVTTTARWTALSALTEAIRRVALSQPTDDLGDFFAWGVATVDGAPEGTKTYHLNKVRGLNPVSTHSPVIARVERDDEDNDDTPVDPPTPTEEELAALQSSSV